MRLFPRYRSDLLLAALLAVAVLAQAAAPEPAWLDPDRTEPAGTRYRTFTSKLVGGEVSYLVYLPPDYASTSERRYPVVYWLHGLGGTQRSAARFVSHLDIAIRTGRGPSMIVILVNGMRDAFYCDSPDGRWPIESVIIKELIPHVDSTYRTIADRASRAVEGYSMGGFGAAHLAFKYPEIFGIAGVMAGGMPDKGMLEKRPEIGVKMFGGKIEALMAEHPFTWLEKNQAAIRGRMAIRVAVGDQDSLQHQNQALHEMLERLKIAHEYEVVPGVAHNMPLFYDLLGERPFAFYRGVLGAGGQRAGGPRMAQVYRGESRVLSRGDLEILTFEAEQEYDELQKLYEQSRDAKPAPGTVTTLYLRSRTDRSVQPYAVWLPRDYTPSKRYPLVVQLHGLNSNKTLAGQRTKFRGMRGADWTDPGLQAIVVQCFGRPSTFYQGMGEEDVLETMEEVQRRFPVDADRVYIMGHSMGGAGSYTVGLHYPDLFGAVMPLDAAMGNRLAPPAATPEWMRPQVAVQAVANLYRNARNTDVFFKHAGVGIQGSSTEFSDGIVGQGGFSTTESFPNMQHNFSNFYRYSSWLPQLIEHPIRRSPQEVKFYTNTLRYNRAYWVTIDRLVRHNADATVTAAYEDGKNMPWATGPSVSVATANIGALTLRLADSPAPKNTAVPLVVDGQQVLAGPLPEKVSLVRADGKWQTGELPAAGRAKRHGVQGPIGDAFNSRFLAVYGTADRDLAIAELDAMRNPTGPLTIHGDFPMKAADRITRQEVETYNLILFGTPETNSVLRRMAPSLPAELMGAGGGEGSPVFIYPNPENASRYIVVWTAKVLSASVKGLTSGFVMPVNLLPDWLRVRDGEILSAGHFDGDWRLVPKQP